MGELVVELENIKKKFKFNSLAYVLDSEIGEVVVDNEDALITKYFDPQQNLLIYRYALDDVRYLIDYLKQENQNVLVPFVDSRFVDVLENAGLVVRSIFKDYFKHNLEDVENINGFDVLELSEAHRASMITQNARNTSRGFFGQTTQWIKGWMLGTIDDVIDIGVKHQKILVYREQQEIAGIICLGLYGYDKESGPILWIRELVVDQAYQGKKIGQRLLKKGLSYGKLKHARKAFLHVDVLNKNAIHIYEKYGFVSADDIGQIDMIYHEK